MKSAGRTVLNLISATSTGTAVWGGGRAGGDHRVERWHHRCGRDEAVLGEGGVAGRERGDGVVHEDGLHLIMWTPSMGVRGRCCEPDTVPGAGKRGSLRTHSSARPNNLAAGGSSSDRPPDCRGTVRMWSCVSSKRSWQ